MHVCSKSTGSGASQRWSPPTSTTPNCGRCPATGSTMRWVHAWPFSGYYSVESCSVFTLKSGLASRWWCWVSILEASSRPQNWKKKNWSEMCSITVVVVVVWSYILGFNSNDSIMISWYNDRYVKWLYNNYNEMNKNYKQGKKPDSEIDFWLLHSLLASEVIRVEVKHLHPFDDTK